jgi:hypothetical protein
MKSLKIIKKHLIKLIIIKIFENDGKVVGVTVEQEKIIQEFICALYALRKEMAD